LATALLGFLIGFRLNLWRDKRKEFNIAAETFYERLISKQPLSDSDFSTFARYLRCWEIGRFKSKVSEYKQASQKITKQTRPENSFYTHAEISDPQRAKEIIEELKSFTKRK